MGYDYEKGNGIVDWILELDQLYSRDNESLAGKALLERRAVLNQAEKADCLLKAMDCDTRRQAELILREMQREVDTWALRKGSLVGRSVLLSLGAFVIACCTYISNAGLMWPNIVASIVMIALLVMWATQFASFNRNEKNGQISRIADLSHMITAWLLLHSKDD